MRVAPGPQVEVQSRRFGPRTRIRTPFARKTRSNVACPRNEKNAGQSSRCPLKTARKIAKGAFSNARGKPQPKPHAKSVVWPPAVQPTRYGTDSKTIRPSEWLYANRSFPPHRIVARDGIIGFAAERIAHACRFFCDVSSAAFLPVRSSWHVSSAISARRRLPRTPSTQLRDDGRSSSSRHVTVAWRIPKVRSRSPVDTAATARK